MSARFNVGVIDSNGDAQTSAVVRVYTTAGDTLVASTDDLENDAAGVDDMVDNNDGNYYLDSLDSGNYYVTIDGASQPELANIEWDDTDNQTHIANSSKHRTIDDSKGDGDTTYLWSANKIYDQLALKLDLTDVDDSTIEESGGSIQLKDNGITQAKMGDDSVGTAEIIDDNVTVAKIDYDTDDFEADGTELSILQSFSDETIISEDKTLNQNLERLQKEIHALEDSTGGLKRRVVYSDFSATASADTNASAMEEYEATVGNDTIIIRFPYYKLNSDTQMVATMEGKTGDVSNIKLYVNGGYDTGSDIDLGSSSYTTRQATFDTSNLSDETLYDCYILLTPQSGTVNAKNVIVEVKGGE